MKKLVSLVILIELDFILFFVLKSNSYVQYRQNLIYGTRELMK